MTWAERGRVRGKKFRYGGRRVGCGDDGGTLNIIVMQNRWDDYDVYDVPPPLRLVMIVVPSIARGGSFFSDPLFNSHKRFALTNYFRTAGWGGVTTFLATKAERKSFVSQTRRSACKPRHWRTLFPGGLSLRKRRLLKRSALTFDDPSCKRPVTALVEWI